MAQNFTPLSFNLNNLKSNQKLKEKFIIKIFKSLINLVVGLFLIFLGLYFILETIIESKNLFQYTLQLFRPGSYIIFSALVNILINYLYRIIIIIMGNFILFSGINFVFQRKSGFKLLSIAIILFFLSIFLGIISVIISYYP